LREQKRLGDAEAAHRKSIGLKPTHIAYFDLGNDLLDLRNPEEAEAAYRKAIELKSDYAEAYGNLGAALLDQGKLGPAEAVYRQAIKLKSDFPGVHYSLGIVLQGQGRLADAEVAYRKSIELKPDYPEAHCNLGQALRNTGQFAEALTELRRGHELGSKNPRWPYPSAQWVRECERLVELDAKLPRLFKGEVEPADVGERLALAHICQLPRKSLYAAAARFYADAFSAQAELADDLQHELRYDAACAAALAGCGQGKDAKDLPDKVCLGLRRQALVWLRADLAAYRRLLDHEPGKAGPAVRERLQRWQQDTDFAGVRGPEALDKLSQAERDQWQQLWADVADTLGRAREKAAPERKPDSK
jgi:Flp pilus assembly protein TadD